MSARGWTTWSIKSIYSSICVLYKLKFEHKQTRVRKLQFGDETGGNCGGGVVAAAAVTDATCTGYGLKRAVEQRDDRMLGDGEPPPPPPEWPLDTELGVDDCGRCRLG